MCVRSPIHTCQSYLSVILVISVSTAYSRSRTVRQRLNNRCAIIQQSVCHQPTIGVPSSNKRRITSVKKRQRERRLRRKIQHFTGELPKEGEEEGLGLVNCFAKLHRTDDSEIQKSNVFADYSTVHFSRRVHQASEWHGSQI